MSVSLHSPLHHPHAPSLLGVSRSRCCSVCGGLKGRYAGNPRAETYLIGMRPYIKIGVTTVGGRRMDGYFTKRPSVVVPDDLVWDNGLAVIGVITGDVEHELHEAWAHLHAKGEWFRPDLEMLKWMTATFPPVADDEDAV